MTINQLRRRLAQGLVIPACPLALTAQYKLDERHQRALLRYYAAAGAAAWPSVCTRRSLPFTMQRWAVPAGAGASGGNVARRQPASALHEGLLPQPAAAVYRQSTGRQGMVKVAGSWADDPGRA